MFGFNSRVAALLLQATFCIGSTEATPRPTNLTVDLGYALYEGYEAAGFNSWIGMRYAAPPVGDLRWQAPQPPATNRSSVIPATAYGSQCPQSPQSPLPADFNFTQGSEDCLFINVMAPPGAKNLPVMIYIHGGGYGTGNGQLNASDLRTQNITKQGFVLASIQYRLGAFGFLASPDVYSNGSLNAGLLDEHFAIAWTQQHISKFGGDPRQVTIVGESAGGGSVMMQMMAYGGSEGNKYFEQGIAASPYDPVVYNYTDTVPIHRYNRFVQQAGCSGQGNNTMQCLRQVDTDTLQMANALVGSGINYGSWGFVPVLDGDFVRERPSQQLPTGRLNGNRILTGNNADEGAAFVNPNITTNADFNRWLRTEFPLLTQQDIHEINTVHYVAQNDGNISYATCGDCGGATAVNVGSFATGPQQRALNLYSEVTFVCPSYWLAQGMTAKQQGSTAGYKYQMSVVPSQHGLDLAAEGFGSCTTSSTPQFGAAYCRALASVWANFLQTGNPDISNALANGKGKGSSAPNPASKWPLFTATGANAYQMLNFNQTGGVLITTSEPLIPGLKPVMEYVRPGFANNISLVDAYSWEGNRGARCDFWRKVGYPG